MSVCCQIVLENYAFPGVLLIGTDSHTPNGGKSLDQATQGGTVAWWLACLTSDREVMGSSRWLRAVAQQSWASCSLHPGPGLTQPSILLGSVNEYRLRSGRYKGRYVRCCSVHAMYLSASAVAGKPNRGAITSVRPLFKPEAASSITGLPKYDLLNPYLCK